jgi:hypothetical protein
MSSLKISEREHQRLDAQRKEIAELIRKEADKCDEFEEESAILDVLRELADAIEGGKEQP